MKETPRPSLLWGLAPAPVRSQPRPRPRSRAARLVASGPARRDGAQHRSGLSRPPPSCGSAPGPRSLKATGELAAEMGYIWHRPWATCAHRILEVRGDGGGPRGPEPGRGVSWYSGRTSATGRCWACYVATWGKCRGALRAAAYAGPGGWFAARASAPAPPWYPPCARPRTLVRALRAAVSPASCRTRCRRSSSPVRTACSWASLLYHDPGQQAAGAQRRAGVLRLCRAGPRRLPGALPARRRGAVQR
jgi:hypothetical protein